MNKYCFLLLLPIFMPVIDAVVVVMDVMINNAHQPSSCINNKSYQYHRSTPSFISSPSSYKRWRGKQNHVQLEKFGYRSHCCPHSRFIICTSHHQAKDNNNIIDSYNKNNNDNENENDDFLNDPSKLYKSLQGNVTNRIRNTLAKISDNDVSLNGTIYANGDIDNAENVKRLLEDISKRAQSSIMTTIDSTEMEENVAMNDDSLDPFTLVNAANLRTEAILKQACVNDDDSLIVDNDSNDEADNDKNNKNVQFASDEMITSILQRATKTLDGIQSENNGKQMDGNFEMNNEDTDGVNEVISRNKRGEKNEQYQQDVTNLLNIISSRARNNLASHDNTDSSSFKSNPNYFLVDIAAQRAMDTINVEYNISSADSIMNAMKNRANAVVDKRKAVEWIKWNDTNDDDWNKNDLWEKDEWDKNEW